MCVCCLCCWVVDLYNLTAQLFDSPRTELLDEKNRALEAKATAEGQLKEAEDNIATLDEELNAAAKVWVDRHERSC